MQNKCQVVADDMGNVVRQSQNPEFGHVRLESNKVVYSASGWASVKRISTLIQGKLEDLQYIYNGVSEISGKIIIKESLTPFNASNPDRDIKMAGDTGIVCCVDGQPIYRKTFFTKDQTAEDVLIAHDNGDAIREANGTNSNAVNAAKVTPAQAFGIDTDSEEVDNEVEETVEDSVEEEVLEEETFEL